MRVLPTVSLVQQALNYEGHGYVWFCDNNFVEFHVHIFSNGIPAILHFHMCGQKRCDKSLGSYNETSPLITASWFFSSLASFSFGLLFCRNVYIRYAETLVSHGRQLLHRRAQYSISILTKTISLKDFLCGDRVFCCSECGVHLVWFG